MDELLTELRHLGLSDKESAVYLASLELGPASVQDICHKAKVNRATTYVMIESLSGRGLMSAFVKGKKRFYSPENPDRLMSLVRMQQKELEEKENELSKALPMLMALFNAEGAKPQIRYLEGPEGLKTARATFEKLEGEFVQIVPFDDVQNTRELLEEHGKHTVALKQQRAPHRVLAVMEKPDASKIPNVGVGEFRVVPSSEFPIHGEITVRGNHVFMYSYRSAILSVVVISKEVADAVRALFDLAWKGAASYPEKKLSE